MNASMLTDDSVLSGVSAKPFLIEFLFESVKFELADDGRDRSKRPDADHYE